MSASKRKSKLSTDHSSDLASLVSSIKKNVGSVSADQSAQTKTIKPTLPSNGAKSSTQKPKATEPIKEFGKNQRKERGEKPKPNPKKRNREEMTQEQLMLKEVEKDEDAWDEQFEKDDIDDIFGKLKKSKAAKETAQKEQQEEEEALRQLLKRAEANSANSSAALRAKLTKKDPNRRYTEDGLPIYTTTELGLNSKCGDTDLCPFDCDCCF